MADKEIINRREFQSPDGDTTYYIAAPTAEDIRGADWQYSKTYTKSLMDGITTSSEMMDILMRRGIIGPEFEKRQAELTNMLTAKAIELQKCEDIDEKQKLAIEVASAREELFNWNQRLNGPMANTCEQISDDARLEYLTCRIVQNADGTRVWDTIEDYFGEEDQGLAMRARFEVMLFLQGLQSDFLEQTPEAVALREVEEEARKKAEDAMAELEKELEKEIQEEIKEDKKPKKKSTRGRKKKAVPKKKDTSKKKASE